MRKGDEKRRELLQTAEQFFCRKGYEETSVQEIIDAASSSKGGFYHYFPSKESVLEALCSMRAAAAAEQVHIQTAGMENTVDRINCILSGMLPLHQDARSFLEMMLPVLKKPEGLPVLVCWQNEIMKGFLPMLTEEIDNARRSQCVYPVRPGISRPIAVLVNRCWAEVLQVILTTNEKAQKPEAAALLEILETYRRSIEVLLDAPFGSVQLANLRDWESLALQLAEGLRRIH